MPTKTWKVKRIVAEENEAENYTTDDLANDTADDTVDDKADDPAAGDDTVDDGNSENSEEIPTDMDVNMVFVCTNERSEAKPREGSCTRASDGSIQNVRLIDSKIVISQDQLQGLLAIAERYKNEHKPATSSAPTDAASNCAGIFTNTQNRP